MRLIDADTLLSEHTRFVHGEEFGVNRPIAVVTTKDILNMPTIDEQKHGHFIPNEFISSLGMCSVCEHPIDDGDDYCKWCGAKMDEVSE